MQRIWKGIGAVFGYLWRALDGARKVLHLLLLLFLFALLLSAVPGPTFTIVDNSALVIRPVGTLVEERSGDPFERAQAELLGRVNAETVTHDVVDALRFAAKDKRINVVHLELSALGGGGMSKLQTIAAEITKLRDAGKTVIASAEFVSQAGYYLAAHADEFYMHPDGILFLPGFASYRNYYSEAIDKLKIDWNIFRVGTHKSFVEPYTRMDMSDEDRESRRYLVDTLWSQYREGVVAARDLPENSVADFVDNMLQRVEQAGGDLMQAALQADLLDGLLSRAELRERMLEMVHADDDALLGYRAVEMGDYLSEQRLLNAKRVGKENVAVVVAAGEFQLGSQPPGTIGSESTSALLRRALNDDTVFAVVVRIDSPGGATYAADVIGDEIEALQQAGKPVIASMSSVAASAGYYIAAGADRILAQPTTLTGSIGIFGMFPTYQRSLEVLGVATSGVGSSVWAGQLRPDREMSPEARQMFQMLVEDGYDDFITHIANYRGMDKDAVDRIGQGQVWLGVDALEKGLIDRFGGLDDAIELAAELGEYTGKSYGIKRFEQELSPSEQMIVDILSVAKSLGMQPSRWFGSDSATQRLARRLDESLSALDRFNDPKGIYSHCFCEFDGR
ncbi:MAG: signal peptide peptidase SppA [Woeseiaceae bacterium]